uniref:Transducer of ERBB2, 2 n=1 Tax=Takifugu rubripes TaxID=31033 RepID=A0A674PFI2_TAKRU
MHLEVKVALNFIVSYLYNKLPRRRADLFGEELEKILVSRFVGHWYPEAPLRGSAFRCIHLGAQRDPVVELAAKRSGLDTEEVRANVPAELSVWIDPFEVSYQIGEKGAVKVLYLEDPPVMGCDELGHTSTLPLSFFCHLWSVGMSIIYDTGLSGSRSGASWCSGSDGRGMYHTCQ